MKFSFKIEAFHLLPLIIPYIISVVIAILNKTVTFSFSEAFALISILYLPVLLISLVLIFASYCTLDDNSINIFFFGFLNKSISYESIEAIEVTDKGYNFFALAKSKLRIKTHSRDFILSIKDKELFIRQINAYVHIPE
ncbi:MAG TPA: EbsA family protein [Clostridia bacterium]|nr:EbsA family protein [Clostridia bacterium]